MLFSNYRHELEAQAARKVASAGGSRFQNSAFANTFVAPMLANRFPYIITPYLGLRARLSQIWINRWTVLLLLVLVRTVLAIATLYEDINLARREALSACSGVESVGSAMASMPHYLSQGVNALTADGVDRAVNGLMSMLLMTVTGVEEIVLFIIHMLTSTYLCLITLVARGALHAGIALIEDASHFINSTVGAIGHDIHTAVEDFESAYNTFLGGLNDIGSAFGSTGSIPRLNINSQIQELNHVHLPSGLDADLQKLNQNIPTFAQVENFTNAAISWPFQEIKKLINDALPNYSFDRSLLPVPAKQHLTFCSDNNGINHFFNDLIDLNDTARKLSIAVLLVLAVIVCGPMTWREIHSYRKMQKRAATLRERSKAPMDSVYTISRPYTSDAGLKAASAFKASRHQTLVRWAIAYATTVPALFVLSLGVAGLFSCLCRYILLEAIQHEVPELINEVADFADEVVVSLNNASVTWANGANDVVLKMSNQINNDVFGWVNTSTHAINHTLNVFVDESIHVINEEFGGTVLDGPIKELFKCLIGLKITSIEKGLTWVHEHAHINFPLLPNNTFSLGAAASITNNSDASSFLANPSRGTTDEITAIVNALAAKFANSIRTEAIISACLVGIWVVIALMGICRVVWLFYGKGHMPEDYGLDPGNEAAPAEKSPSFIGTGEYYGSPANPQQPYTQEKAAVPEISLQHPYLRNTPTEDHNLPDYLNVPGNANAGNQYRGKSYTITPRPFPKFSSYNNSSSSLMNHNDSATQQNPFADPAENVGYAGERDMRGSTQRPEHPRRSEHGFLERQAKTMQQ